MGRGDLVAAKIRGDSGTIGDDPNATEIANWIDRVHRPIAVGSHDQRAVPLQHLYFTGDNQPVPNRELVAHFASDEFDPKAGTIPVEDRYWERGWHQSFGSSHHLDLINYVIGQRLLPCLYFVFSRRGCEARAEQLARSVNFLKPQEKRAVEVTVRRTIQDRGINRDDIPNLNQLQAQWSRGIGVHHAGLLPIVKEIVEELLSRRLLRVLYVTETFAVGVNMPVKCVCFDSLYKFDGKRRRLLTQQEYFQMAGRAGRRGLDRQVR